VNLTGDVTVKTAAGKDKKTGQLFDRKASFRRPCRLRRNDAKAGKRV
jgi:hypothetical protein